MFSLETFGKMKPFGRTFFAGENFEAIHEAKTWIQVDNVEGETSMNICVPEAESCSSVATKGNNYTSRNFIWVVKLQLFCNLNPCLGKILILTNIFHMGWNPQLEIIRFLHSPAALVREDTKFN